MSSEDERNAARAKVAQEISDARRVVSEKRADLLSKLLATHTGIQTLVKAGAPKAQVLEGLAALGWGLEQLAVIEQQIADIGSTAK